MTIFEMVKYHAKEYPRDIPLRIEECAAHMDITAVHSTLKRSMHTEYSYGQRRFGSGLMTMLPNLKTAQKDGVPQLWHSNEWSIDFADFMIALCGPQAPAVIEIHPPFSDYCDMESFIDRFCIFESIIHDRYPDTEILIENRCGSVYRGGRFLISKYPDVAALCDQICRLGLRLKIAYDIPQLYTAHNSRTRREYAELIYRTKEIRSFIGGVHLWGKKRADGGRLISHCGDLTSYFSGDTETKAVFLDAFCDCFSDGCCRKMVLEVNSSNEDLSSIISDLCGAGVRFV